MQTNYSGPQPNYADTLQSAVAVWRNKEAGQTYGYPLAKPWVGATYPKLLTKDWEFLGVMPAGTPISDVTPQNENDVGCKVNGTNMLTSNTVVTR